MPAALRSSIMRGLPAIAAVVLLSSALAATPADYRLAVWPPHAASPQFNLVGLDGAPRSLADYRGRLVVVFFGFVQCPDACPAELFKLALALKQLGKAGDRVQVLFITLDPERDTPAVLESYVAAFDSR